MTRLDVLKGEEGTFLRHSRKSECQLPRSQPWALDVWSGHLSGGQHCRVKSQGPHLSCPWHQLGGSGFRSLTAVGSVIKVHV